MGLFFTFIVVCVVLIIAMHIIDGCYIPFEFKDRKWYHHIIAELQSIDFEVPLIIIYGLLVCWVLIGGISICCIRAGDTDKLYEAKIVYEQYQETGRCLTYSPIVSYVEREKVRRFANDHPFLAMHNKKAVDESLKIWTELKNVKDR